MYTSSFIYADDIFSACKVATEVAGDDEEKDANGRTISNVFVISDFWFDL